MVGTIDNAADRPQKPQMMNLIDAEIAAKLTAINKPPLSSVDTVPAAEFKSGDGASSTAECTAGCIATIHCVPACEATCIRSYVHVYVVVHVTCKCVV